MSDKDIQIIYDEEHTTAPDRFTSPSPSLDNSDLIRGLRDSLEECVAFIERQFPQEDGEALFEAKDFINQATKLLSND